MLNYKPDFPSSILHVTLFDGPPSELAGAALSSLSKLPWGFKVTTGLTLFNSTKAAMAASSTMPRFGTVLTFPAATLLEQLLRQQGLAEIASLDALETSERLELMRAAAEFLHTAEGTESVPARPLPDFYVPAHEPTGQMEFWSVEELGASPKRQVAVSNRKSNKRRSAVITPPELAKDVAVELAKHLDSEEMIDFGDPAVGSGILYAAVRHVFGADRVNSARVVEIDQLTASLVERRWARAGISVCNGDFLEVPPEPDSWSLVLANPPYLRSQAIQADLAALRTWIHSQLGISVSARSDLYVYFLLRAHSWLREGAVAAWILPSEFQVTKYGEALRSYLSSHVTLLRMHTYSALSPLFDNALTSTTVILYEKRPPRAGWDALVSSGGTLDLPSLTRSVPVKQLASTHRWSFQALSHRSEQGDSVTTLGELFTFKRGIATGANASFVLSEEQVRLLEARDQWLRPLVPPSRELGNDHIEADESGLPISPFKRWVIDTNLDIETIAAESPVFASYLTEVMERVGNRHLVSRREFPFQQDDRLPAPFLFVYMAKSESQRGRFIRNDSSATYLNNYIGLYPRAASMDVYGSIEEMHSMLKAIPHAELQRAGRIYGKGLLKLEPGELSLVEVRKR